MGCGRFLQKAEHIYYEMLLHCSSPFQCLCFRAHFPGTVHHPSCFFKLLSRVLKELCSCIWVFFFNSLHANGSPDLLTMNLESCISSQIFLLWSYQQKTQLQFHRGRYSVCFKQCAATRKAVVATGKVVVCHGLLVALISVTGQ